MSFWNVIVPWEEREWVSELTKSGQQPLVVTGTVSAGVPRDPAAEP
jgi:hypothetical protein